MKNAAFLFFSRRINRPYSERRLYFDNDLHYAAIYGNRMVYRNNDNQLDERKEMKWKI